jgi:hypothetical protein
MPGRVLNLQSPCLEQENLLLHIEGAGVAQSVQCLTTDWTTWVRCQERQIMFPLVCVQTSSEAHPASCTMGIGGPFRGTKRGRGVTLTTHPHLVPRSRMISSYISSNPKRLRCVSWDSFRFYLCVQTSSEAHPVFCTVGTWDPFAGQTWTGCETDPLVPAWR